MRTFFIIIITVLFLVSCTTEKQAGGRKTTGSGTKEEVRQAGAAAERTTFGLEITPKNAARNAVLSLSPSGFALADAQVEWYVNNSLFETEFPHLLPASGLDKGDTVQARALVSGSEVLSAPVTIMNTPPELARVELLPATVKPEDPLRIVAEGKDLDDDEVSFVYEWTRNGEPAGTGSVIEGLLKSGDKVVVKITPFDGEDYGFAFYLKREIGNAPPVIADKTEFTFNGTDCSYRIEASDPDGDLLRYSLENAPAGMTIDPATGRIQWAVPPDFKGVVEVTAVVDDGRGGTARCAQKITINEAKPRTDEAK
jgi:hypothetical protein